MKIAPSVLAADFTRLGEEINRVSKADYIHLDIMDGHFVPNISFGHELVAALRPLSSVPFDVHLMMDHPLFYIPSVVRAGADLITFHVECSDSISETIDAIHQGGAKAGLVLKPGTPVETLWPWLDRIDMVLVMTVEPGFGGQAYIPESTEKIRRLRRMLDERGLDTDIEVDGGIKKDNLKMVLEAGANVIVAGSAIFKGDIEQNTREFLEIMGE